MKLVIRMVITLIALWFVLSGLLKTQLVILGLMSVALVAWLAVRMQVLEHRGQPIYFRLFYLMRYWGWLLVEIMKSNVAVTRLVLDPALPIKPMLRRIKATPHTEIGRVIYANSITLTPGTTAINFTPSGEILVHALHEDSLHELEEGIMADHIKAVEPHIPVRPGAGAGGQT
ncbi:MAG: Na+/H+ antiporter subunit E [Granulosicoccus sp.]|nr:Na+/H+ antiporter subunit E [Granulosicoccus sp.]